MARTRSRLLVLAVMAGVLVVPAPAVAQEPEPVSELRVKVAGMVELSDAELENVYGGYAAGTHYSHCDPTADWCDDCKGTVETIE